MPSIKQLLNIEEIKSKFFFYQFVIFMKGFSKEIKIAVTAIIAIVVIYLGVIFLKGIKFSKSSNIFYVEMNDVNGLAASAPILANGVQIGLVNSVRFVSDKQNVLLTVEFDEGVKIPKGSSASLTKEMLGAAKLKINLGDLKNGFMQVNDTIYGTSSTDILSAAGELAPQLETIMSKIDTLLSAVTVLVTNPSITNSLYNVQSLTQNVQSASKALPEMMSHFDMMSDNLYNMSSGLSSASGQVTYVMDDAKDMMANLKSASQSVENLCVDMNGKVPNILNSVNDIGTNLSLTTEKLKEAELDQLISNLNVSVNNLNSLTASLNDIMNNQESTLGKILYDPDVYNKLDSTLENASKLLEDLKSHPKRYVHFSLFGKKDK